MWFMQTLPPGALRFYRPYTKFMMTAQAINLGWFVLQCADAAHAAEIRYGDTDFGKTSSPDSHI